MKLEFQPEQYRSYLLVLARIELAKAGPVRHKMEASDLVQDVLLKAHRARVQFNGNTPGELMAWLRRIQANALKDAQKRWGAKKQDAAREDPLYESMSRSSLRLNKLIAAGQESPSAYVVRRERGLVLADALNALPADQRTAVELHHLAGYSLREVADAMNRSQPSVAGFLRRGLQTLRQKLESLE
jgi:RNA polymerase sigma-70 factor (ECF subfamily)